MRQIWDLELTHVTRDIGTLVQRVGHMGWHWSLHLVLAVDNGAWERQGATAGGVVIANGRGIVQTLVNVLELHLIMMYPEIRWLWHAHIVLLIADEDRE